MRIVCPSCDAEYDVPTSRIKPGKMVRCVRCGGEWVAAEVWENAADGEDAHSPPDLEAETMVPSAPSLAATVNSGASRAARPPSVGLIVAWVLSILVLTAAAAAMVVWRQDIVRHWPPSSRILGTSTEAEPKVAPGSGHDMK